MISRDLQDVTDARSGNAGRRAGLTCSAVLGGVLAAAAVLIMAGCGQSTSRLPPAQLPDADPQRGAQLISSYGCGSCHTVAGVRGADGQVGPPLSDFGRRSYIAGMLPNTPGNLQHWIRDPQQVVPGNAMPDLGVTAADARDIAAFLLKEGR
jgi:cytochrome c2